MRLQAAHGLHLALPIFAALKCGPTRQNPQRPVVRYQTENIVIT